ncbi:MAG TPA: hypothetical protein VNA20_06085 [Frankiaceae bacterium]|nr:hypothetical protein [Frankiaceae bacterium]
MTAIITGCGTADGSEFRGAIIVPGSDAANREVARDGGCEGCIWILVVDCDPNEVDGGSLVNCNAARCPDGTMYRIYLQRPTDANPRYVDNVCLTPTRRIVTVAELNADMEKYLTALRPPATEIVVQPRARSVVGIPTYFVARGPDTDSTTLEVTTAAGPATLLIDVAASRYAWDFGDGTRCETDAAGTPYGGGEPAEQCGERVAHAYRTARDVAVTLRATWRGTYSFDVGFGPVGPLPIPGDGVPGPPATVTVDVRPARAQLVGG